MLDRLDKIRDNLQQNLTRVENLVRTYETHPNAQRRGRKNAAVLGKLVGSLLDLAPHGLAASERRSRLVRSCGLATYYGCPGM